MKKFSFLALAAVGLLFGACASNDAIEEKAPNGGLAGDGQGYFKVGINLPDINNGGTRADWNEDGLNTKLHDGKASEWTVENTVLLIFAGTSESTATLAQVNTFAGDYTNYADDPNQVTSRKEYVVELTASRANNLYALAVVNGAGIIEQGSGNSVKINGGSEVSGITLSNLQEALATAAPTGQSDLAGNFVNASDHIFMTNAVLSDKQGGKEKPTGANTFTLAPIDKSEVYTTSEGALAGNAAADIYVERGVAKVTISNSSTLTVSSGITTSGTATAPTATLAGWGLDNTNKSSYLVRNVPASFDWTLINQKLLASSTTDKYRFVGNTSVDGAGKVGWRTYWAKDPNYDVAYSAANFYEPATKKYVTAIGDENPLYCFENTFTVANQIVKNTTRAIVKVTFNGGNDFFTVNGDRKTIYPMNELKKLVVSNLFTDGAFIAWYATNGLPESDANNLKKIYEQIGITFDYGTKASGAPGLITVKEITIPNASVPTLSADVDLSTETGLTDIIGRINGKLGEVQFYDDGAAYYAIRIQHFGEDLTPWGAGESTTEPQESTLAKIYPDAPAGTQDANYLGRYGMVRNNWYELTLGDILKIGSPVLPGISGGGDPDDPPTDPTDPNNPDHPDDSVDELYIKARINILSWAKRPQTWNLKN